MSGKWFNPCPTACEDDQLIDMDEVARIARDAAQADHRGGTAYSREWTAGFRAIADEVGAYLLVDMATFRGLVAGGAHPAGAARACHHHHHAQELRGPRRASS
jgi:glycine hydroxymethyltransferase